MWLDSQLDGTKLGSSPYLDGVSVLQGLHQSLGYPQVSPSRTNSLHSALGYLLSLKKNKVTLLQLRFTKCKQPFVIITTLNIISSSGTSYLS